jgi:hypothetical protein
MVSPTQHKVYIYLQACKININFVLFVTDLERYIYDKIPKLQTHLAKEIIYQIITTDDQN